MNALVLAAALNFAPTIDLFGDIKLRAQRYDAGDAHIFERPGVALDMWDYNFLLVDGKTQLSLMDERLEELRREMTRLAAEEVTRATLTLRAENNDLRDILELKNKQLFAVNEALAEEKHHTRMLTWGTCALGGVVLGLGIFIAVTR